MHGAAAKSVILAPKAAMVAARGCKLRGVREGSLRPLVLSKEPETGLGCVVTCKWRMVLLFLPSLPKPRLGSSLKRSSVALQVLTEAFCWPGGGLTG